MEPPRKPYRVRALRVSCRVQGIVKAMRWRRAFCLVWRLGRKRFEFLFEQNRQQILFRGVILNCVELPGMVSNKELNFSPRDSAEWWLANGRRADKMDAAQGI